MITIKSNDFHAPSGLAVVVERSNSAAESADEVADAKSNAVFIGEAA
jgi:hypothetical protein